MRIRALSFDLFDTLIDLHMGALPEFEVDGKRYRGTHPALFRALPADAGIEFDAFARALVGVDLELRMTRLAEGRELPTLERFRALVDRLDLAHPGLPERLTDTHMGELARLAHTPAHHAELLAKLAERFALALCSNFSHAPTALRLLAGARMQPLFRALVISEDVGFRKPRLEIFEAVRSGLELEPAAILHIGDRLEADVGGAAAAGFRTAWLTRRVPSPEEQQRHYSGPAPDFVLNDLAELPERLEASG